jgi:hypothetical protein
MPHRLPFRSAKVPETIICAMREKGGTERIR